MESQFAGRDRRFELYYSQYLVSNSPYCLSYNSYDASFWEFGIGSTNNLIIDIFLPSHHLSAWYCINIVRRNSVLVTDESGEANSVFYFINQSLLFISDKKWLKYGGYRSYRVIFHVHY